MSISAGQEPSDGDDEDEIEYRLDDEYLRKEAGGKMVLFQEIVDEVHGRLDFMDRTVVHLLRVLGPGFL